MNTEITRLCNPLELEAAKTLLTEIRFECLVKIFDFAQVDKKSAIPFVQRKPLPPQWFKAELKISLEAIKYEDECQLGKMIKDAYRKLEDRIQEYEMHHL